jgi:hypothetical protein
MLTKVEVLLEEAWKKSLLFSNQMPALLLITTPRALSA